MRKYYSLAAAALILALACSDDGSNTTEPRLSGAVVGADLDRGGNSGNAPNDNQDHSGRRLDVTLLRGDEEVPPHLDTDARGRLALKLNKDGQTVSYVLSVSDIRNVTQAHIHMAPRGQNGQIIVWLFPSAKYNAATNVGATALPAGGGPVEFTYEGTFTAADFRPPFAGQPLSVLLNAIAAGNAYGNVHTSDGTATQHAGNYPGGEIRGQLESHGH